MRTEKSDSLKSNIKNQPGERDSETMAIYVPLFRRGIPKALLKFVTIIHNIIKGQDLSAGPQKFGMTQNLVVGEADRRFNRGGQKNANYELVMKYLIFHFPPPKALQCQKRCLSRGLYKPPNTNIRYFIFTIDKMVEYLENFSPFGSGQRLPEDEILELVEFSLPKEWQKELIIQGFYSTTKGLTELVKFCKHLETVK